MFLLNEFLETAKGRYFFGISIPSLIVFDSRKCRRKCFVDREGLLLKQFSVELLIVIISFLKVYKLWTKHSSSFCSSSREDGSSCGSLHTCAKAVCSLSLVP